jgi:hypothetical protein
LKSQSDDAAFALHDEARQNALETVVRLHRGAWRVLVYVTCVSRKMNDNQANIKDERSNDESGAG